MTTTSLPQDPSAILADVEAFFSELPEKPRRKRAANTSDQTPESENYVTASEPEHDPAALAQFHSLLRQLGKARSDVVAEVLIVKICRLLDLPMDGGR